MNKNLVAVISGLLIACGKASDRPAATTAADTPQVASVVDSVLPMDVMIARFRKGVPQVKELTSGAPTRDSLVRQVVNAFARQDTVRLVQSTVNLREFAWLYFPTSINAKPPYELAPALAWFRLQESDRTGVLRGLREVAGHRLQYHGYACDKQPRVEAANRIWIGCLVSIAVDGAKPRPYKLFSSILERDHRFAILSFGNDF